MTDLRVLGDDDVTALTEDGLVAEHAPVLFRLTAPLDAASADELTSKIRAYAHRLTDMTCEIYWRRGWAAMGYGSFVEWAQEELEVRRSSAYQLVDEIEVDAVLRAGLREGEPLPPAGVHARHLRRLGSAREIVEVWREAVASAPGGEPTGAATEQLVRARLERAPSLPVAKSTAVDTSPPSGSDGDGPTWASLGDPYFVFGYSHHGGRTGVFAYARIGEHRCRILGAGLAGGVPVAAHDAPETGLVLATAFAYALEGVHRPDRTVTVNQAITDVVGRRWWHQVTNRVPVEVVAAAIGLDDLDRHPEVGQILEDGLLFITPEKVLERWTPNTDATPDTPPVAQPVDPDDDVVEAEIVDEAPALPQQRRDPSIPPGGRVGSVPEPVPPASTPTPPTRLSGEVADWTQRVSRMGDDDLLRATARLLTRMADGASPASIDEEAFALLSAAIACDTVSDRCRDRALSITERRTA